MALSGLKQRLQGAGRTTVEGIIIQCEGRHAPTDEGYQEFVTVESASGDQHRVILSGDCGKEFGDRFHKIYIDACDLTGVTMNMAELKIQAKFEGELKTRSWRDRQNNWIKKTELAADKVEWNPDNALANLQKPPAV